MPSDGSQKVSHTVVWGAIGLALVLTAFLVVFAYISHPTRQVPAVTQEPVATTTSPIQQHLNYPILKTVPFNTNNNLDVYAIRKITEGKYKGNTLALAIGLGSGMYAYYIADDAGNAIAWDQSIDCTGLGPCSSSNPFRELEMTADNHVTDIGIPEEMHFAHIITSRDKKASFFTGSINFFASSTTDPYDDASNKSNYHPYKYEQAQIVDYSPEGNPIVRVPYEPLTNTNNPLITSSYVYYIVFNTGGREEVGLVPDFLGTPTASLLWGELSTGTSTLIRWTTGDTDVASYGPYQYGDCFKSIGSSDLSSTFIKTGTTYSGDPLYEVDSARYPEVYTCLNAMQHIDWNGGKLHTYANEQFLKMHPLFFWQSPYGEWMPFIRSDVYERGPHD